MTLIVIFSRSYIWFLFSCYLYSLFFCTTFKTIFLYYIKFGVYSLPYNFKIRSVCGSESAVCFPDDFPHAVLFPCIFCDYFWFCVFDFMLFETLFLGLFWAYVSNILLQRVSAPASAKLLHIQPTGNHLRFHFGVLFDPHRQCEY